MRCRLSIPVLFLSLAAVVPAHAEKARKPVPPHPAAQYRFHDAHANEHVTIAAEAGDTKETRPDTRLDYYAHDMLPMRVIVTNDSDRALTLDDARIDFIAADNTKVPAATTDDLNRRLFELKQTKPVRIPLIGLEVHKKPVDTKILADDADFGFKTTTVAPHTTVAGYLYYDTEGLPEPALKNATLELREVRWKNANSAVFGDALDSFEIPLSPADRKK
jgi:hypothetical protein